MRNLIVRGSLLSLLFIFSSRINAQPKDEAIQVKKLDIAIQADMFTATSILNIELFNPNNKIMDGEFLFSLKEEQIITGFGLDINGYMRDGVITEKQKARVAYENVIRRRIDPAILEMTTANNYRVRVYPMPAVGTRKIRIIISQRLMVKGDQLLYQLPLDINSPVDSLSIAISTSNVKHKPATGGGILRPLRFHQEEKNFRLSYKARNAEAKTAISFFIDLPESDRWVCSQRSGDSLKFALHLKRELPTMKSIAFSSATVFWDVSGSALKRNLKSEIEFLESLIAQHAINRVTIVVFSNTIHESKVFYERSIIRDVRRFLKSQVPDGGTQLGSLDCSKFDADVFFLFSDGFSNFRNPTIKTNRKPVYTVNSAAIANDQLLREIAIKTGGLYLNLNGAAPADVLATMNRGRNQLIHVTAGGKTVITHRDMPFEFEKWITISGELPLSPDKNDIALSFGEESGITKEVSVQCDTAEVCDTATFDILQRIYAYENLLGENDENRLFSLARDWKIVSAVTSFIVLDNVQDYIDYGIEPPADLQPAYRKLKHLVKAREDQLRLDEMNAVRDNLKKAAALYNQRINWWDKKATLIDLNSVGADAKPERSRGGKADEHKDESNEGIDAKAQMTDHNSLQEVVVIGYGTHRNRMVTGSLAIVRGQELSKGGVTLQEALQGRVAGVQVVRDNSSERLAPKVFMRGAGTLTGLSAPLYIIDGMPVDGDFIATLNINDIESVTVLKNIQASVLYGSRAANGAIVIKSKTGNSIAHQYQDKISRYSELEDEDYITDLKNADRRTMYQRYLEMKDSLGKNAAYYFDIAELMFQAGDRELAMRILSNIAELDHENHQLLRSMGYMLESWDEYDAAVDMYKRVLQIKEEEPQSYRDLALAYERKGDHQQAVDVLYASVTKNWHRYEDRYRGLKSILMNEMNAIIHQNHDSLDLSGINEAIIRPLPVDLRIVIDWNKDETDIDLHISEPGGEECLYSNKMTKSGGRLSEDFTQGYGPEEYQIRNAKKGKYIIRLNYYGDRYQKSQVPSAVKLSIYKNFGKHDQSVIIHTLMMNNQKGMIEIAEVKW